MSDKKPTISDVAKLAKVGKTSVSRYLNGQFPILSDEIKQRIKDSIQELNYQPSQIARSMKRGKTKLIALIFADISNTYSVDIMRKIEELCLANGYTLLVFNTNNDDKREQIVAETLSKYQVEGIIIQTTKTNNSNFKNMPIPIVSIDRPILNLDCDVIALDNYHASQLIIEHLIDNEFEDILFITPKINHIYTREMRVEVFRKFVGKHKIEGDVVEVDNIDDPIALDAVIYKFYKSNKLKKAIISVNGATTLAILLSLQRLKITQGKDIGVIGFDELPWAQIIGNGITTLCQPIDKIGGTAFNLLLKRICGDKSDYVTILYKGNLIVRHSTMM